MNTRTRRLFARAFLALLATGFAALASNAEAACGCPSGGVPRFLSWAMRGNDLNEIRGDCAAPGATVQVQVMQEHIQRLRVCPPACPSGNNFTDCIGGCQWLTIGQRTANSSGHFVFPQLDQSMSIQLIANQPSQPAGLDGVYTAVRIRARDPHSGQWSAWTNPPHLQAFNMVWPGEETQFAYVEARVSGLDHLQIGIFDGPDDGENPSIALDGDEDTPNFWLSERPTEASVVEYVGNGVCNPQQGCPSTWLVAQAPSINVQSPPLERGNEYPYVLGVVTADKPGAMLIATTIMGPRAIPDIVIHADVNARIDLGIGFDFSLFGGF